MVKNIVLTGGASGIGLAIVERLVDQDYIVWNLDLNACPQPNVKNIACDIADRQSIEAALLLLPVAVDVLIHVAGIAQCPPDPSQVIRVNFFGMRFLNEQLMDRITSGGQILIVASSAGRDWQDNQSVVANMLALTTSDQEDRWLQEHKSSWIQDPYKISKQCAAAYTYLASAEGRQRRIRVNCINPGITRTPLSDNFREMLGSERYDSIVAETGRAGEPQDVAAVVELLALADCQWMSGVEITVDGGYFASTIAATLNARLDNQA
ncbi:MAG TPA: SDR family oxidoreductase [Gammaproteobacteria bacterium]|nr:SDR family oxidoreductase [Gammaproteobacteria bacterium]HIK71365.1 SDR family oxidoreductase [Pseudomonadales bacterium]